MGFLKRPFQIRKHSKGKSNPADEQDFIQDNPERSTSSELPVQAQSQSFKVERVPGNHINVQGHMDPRMVPAVGTIIQNQSQELGYDGPEASSSYSGQVDSPDRTTVQMTTPSKTSRPPPRQPSFTFNAFQDNDSIYHGGSRVSVADTLNSYGDWPEEESYHDPSRRESTDTARGPTRPDDAVLRQGVLQALQDAAIGPSTAVPKAYPKIIQGATIVEPGSEGVMNGLDPDQRSMAGEVFAGRIVHSRPAPPPPIQELPEPEEERLKFREGGAAAGQTRSTAAGRDERAVKFETLRKTSGYTPPLSDHLAPDRDTSGPASSSNHPSAEDYLQMGIDKHEQSQGDEELSESAHYFRKAAEGGSAAGCVFYGLALRHGWGVQRNEKEAFGWLEMGCATVMQKPSTDITEVNGRESFMPMGSQSKLSAEVVMAIYEVGNCFEHAWGVPGQKRNQPNHVMAAMYYRLGAEQGDRDNQEHLALLLSQGKHGLKKDMWEAAYWYRAAIDNGLSPIGLSWVYKDKYVEPRKSGKDVKQDTKEKSERKLWRKRGGETKASA